MNDKELYQELIRDIRTVYMLGMRQRPYTNGQHSREQAARSLLTAVVGCCMNEDMTPEIIIHATENTIEGWNDSRKEQMKGTN